MYRPDYRRYAIPPPSRRILKSDRRRYKNSERTRRPEMRALLVFRLRTCACVRACKVGRRRREKGNALLVAISTRYRAINPMEKCGDAFIRSQRFSCSAGPSRLSRQILRKLNQRPPISDYPFNPPSAESNHARFSQRRQIATDSGN